MGTRQSLDRCLCDAAHLAILTTVFFLSYNNVLVTLPQCPCHPTTVSLSPSYHVLVIFQQCPCHHSTVSLSPSYSVRVTILQCPCHLQIVSVSTYCMSLSPSNHVPVTLVTVSVIGRSVRVHLVPLSPSNRVHVTLLQCPYHPQIVSLSPS